MAVAQSPDGTWLHWEAHGDGEPLLLIMGLGGSGRAWWRLLPHLSGRARAVVLDNRGTGHSDRIRGLLSMPLLVTDVLAVMDAAELESAHVLGVSMGGMIAQHLALDHPERVRSLILGSTTAHGRQGRPPWRMLASVAAKGPQGAEAVWPLVAPTLYARRTLEEHPERVAEDVAIRGGDGTPVATLLAQLAAIAGHDTRARLGELARFPVSILHGTEDLLVPPDRAQALAAGIPGARHVMIEACGHMMTTDAEHLMAQAVLAHLTAADAGGLVAPPSPR
jgi:3-oxoadipate enol-lactonase